MKTIAMIIGVLFFILMLAAVLTANSRWASRMNEYLKRYFYSKDGDHV